MLSVYTHRHFLIPVVDSTAEYFPTSGLGTALTTLPLFLLGHVVLNISLNIPNTALFELSKFAASLLVAVGMVWLWMTLCLLLPKRTALLVALITACGTSAWSLTSQALTSHASACCFINCALYWLARFTLQVRTMRADMTALGPF